MFFSRHEEARSAHDLEIIYIGLSLMRLKRTLSSIKNWEVRLRDEPYPKITFRSDRSAKLANGSLGLVQPP